MRILCVATKLPWPPCDGGRLVLALTLQGLAQAGHDVRLIAPAYDGETAHTDPSGNIAAEAVVVPRMPWPLAAMRASYRRRAISIARHHRAEMEHAVSDALRQFRPDIVHAEQLQALANCSPALAAGIPIVLRTQNVESQIWQQTAAARLLGAVLAFEARRLRIDESRALITATHTLALTGNDATTLRELLPSSGPTRISTLAPPFPYRLPAGPRLEGKPAIVLSGSAGWWPNRQATQWFLREVVPCISRQLPGAVVHLFGGEAGLRAKNVRRHPAPAESIDAFPENAIAAVPLFVGSGIRMRILEAWARGLPVVATSTAAKGLDVISGRELAMADTPEDFCAALSLLADSPEIRTARIDAGRAYLAERHAPAQMTQALLDVYRQAIAQTRKVPR